MSSGTADPGPATGLPRPSARPHHQGIEDVKVRFVRDNTGNLVELVEPLEPADDERTTHS